MNRDIAKDAKRWVIKIGSALLTNDGAGLDRKAVDSWVEQTAQLLSQGSEVVLVSSGAIAEGIVRPRLDNPPREHSRTTGRCCCGANGLDSNLRE